MGTCLAIRLGVVDAGPPGDAEILVKGTRLLISDQ